jgi:hypothetical protein
LLPEISVSCIPFLGMQSQSHLAFCYYARSEALLYWLQCQLVWHPILLSGQRSLNTAHFDRLMGYLQTPTDINENCVKHQKTSESVVWQKIGLILPIKNVSYDTICPIL